MKVLIPAHRIGLTIARSLTKSGIDFVCMGYKGFYNCAFYSKSVKNRRLINKHPLTHPNAFARQLLKMVEADDIDFIFPLGPHEDHVILNHLDEFTDISELAYNPSARRASLDKGRTLAIAQDLGIPIPKTLSLSKFMDSTIDMKYPLIVKPKVANYAWIHAELITGKKEMQSFLRRSIDKEPFLVQEYVPGNGYGFFALYNKKRNLVAYFMHNRIHETLGWGGFSTLSKSHYDERLRSLGERLLKNLSFSGVAMVEFRKDIRSGEFILMEINGRYWGSLPLAISAGVDFPSLHCKYWNRNIETPFSSVRDVCCQWLLGGEGIWLGSIIRNRNLTLPNYPPPSLFTAIRDVVSIRCGTSKKSYYILQRKDLGPASFWLKNFLLSYCPKIHLRPQYFSWVLPRKLAASARPRSRFQIMWLKRRGIKAILSLTEKPLPREWFSRKNGKGLDYFHLPMEDHYPPSVEKLSCACEFFDEKIKQGQPVLVHCLGGYGRTGVVLACFIMTWKNVEPEVAIGIVRKMRPLSIEEQQEESVKKYYLSLMHTCAI